MSTIHEYAAQIKKLHDIGSFLSEEMSYLREIKNYELCEHYLEVLKDITNKAEKIYKIMEDQCNAKNS